MSLTIYSISSQVSTPRYSCISQGLNWGNLGPQWSWPARLQASPSLATMLAGWNRGLDRAWSGLDGFILEMVILSTIRSSRARPHWLQTHPPTQPTWSSAAWHLKTLQSITVRDTVLQPHPECVRNPGGAGSCPGTEMTETTSLKIYTEIIFWVSVSLPPL